MESLPPDREGLLLVRGPNRMLGYLGERERTAAALHEGWYVTGDLAVIDRDAFLAITDRVARFSKIGGEMVPHGRVEDALRSALERACAEIRDANDVELVVTSLPDERRGERLVVLHTPLACSLERWQAETLESGLPRLFLPRRSAYVEVAAIPYLGSGKIDLRAVRELARARAGADR
jgi:acyl-[acyl-carrier-protein]-phospholipid O-acyltransferase/long-chain-fatty-acid--[acyl-carrier-protein] ligase